MLRQRSPRVRDEKRLAWLRTQPCVVCGDNTSSEAAHIRVCSLEHGKEHTGMAQKPDDKWTVSLCSSCHREQHSAGDELKWWSFKGLDPFMIALKLRNP